MDSTKSSDAAVDAAKRLSAKFKCVVCVSGAVDWIVNNSANGGGIVAGNATPVGTDAHVLATDGVERLEDG